MTRARVLVMDDDPLFRSLLAATLRKDYLVSVAADGAEGVAKALEHVPDLAVVDLQMPVRDGLAVLKAFRSHPALRDVPVVMLTGDNSKGSVVTAIQHGVNDYVIKTNFNKLEFLQKISRQLQLKQQSQAESHADSSNSSEGHSTAEAKRPVEASAAAAPASPQQLQSILDNWD